MLIDHNMFVCPERLANAQHDRGNVVFQRVPNGKAEGQTDHACASQHSAQQRSCPHHIHGHDQADHHRDDTAGPGDKVRQEGVRHDPPPETFPRSQKVPQE